LNTNVTWTDKDWKLSPNSVFVGSPCADPAVALRVTLEHEGDVGFVCTVDEARNVARVLNAMADKIDPLCGPAVAPTAEPRHNCYNTKDRYAVKGPVDNW